MKKITLLICVLFSLNGMAQTYDFKTNQALGDWSVVNGATSSFVSGGLEISWTSGQPKLTNTSLTIDASTQKYVIVTLTSAVQEEVHIKTRSQNSLAVQKHTDSQIVLENAFTAPRIFAVDLTHANWTGTINQFDFIFRDNTGTGNLTTSGSVVIEKIEFSSTIPANHTYLFNADGYTEGFTTTDATATVADGVLTFTPNAVDVSPKLIQSSFRMLQTDVSHVHITYKNESALNNELRITYTSSTGTNGGKQWTIGTNDTEYKTITHELAAQADQWNAGNIATNFTVLIRESVDNLTDDTGALKIQSIVFSNSATPPNMFEGGTDSDWATATNWSLNEVPASGSSNPVNDVVTIPATSSAVINATTAAEVTDLTVDSDGSLTITGGGSLIVSGTSTGNVTYNRTLTSKPANADGWHLVSSPVAGQAYNDAWATTNSLATSGSKRGLATFNDANDPKYDYLLNTDANAGTFTSGIGYSMKRSADGTVDFTGTINTADVNGVAVSASATDYVLLGVPYTSYMGSAAFLTANANLNQSQIWVWEQGVTGGNYIASTAKADNFILAPGQGFFVKKATIGATVDFAASNQAANADTFKKSTSTEVKLLVNDGNTERFAKMYYLNNVTKGYDVGYEGETFGGVENKFDVFSHLVEGNQGKNYQVQSLPLSEMESTIVPLGLKVDSEKEVTISAETLNLPTGLKVYLEDRLNNTFTRLDEANTNYKVQVTAGTTEGRFYLHTSAKSVLSTDKELLNSVSIYKSNTATLRIVGLSQGKTSVKIYNVLGKKVMSSNFNANGVKEISLPKLSSGVYVVQLETETGKLNKKIVLE